MEVCIVTKRSFLSCSTTQRQNHGAFNFTSLKDAIYNCHAFPYTPGDGIQSTDYTCSCQSPFPSFAASTATSFLSLVSYGVVRRVCLTMNFTAERVFLILLAWSCCLLLSLLCELDLSFTHLLVSLFCAYKRLLSLHNLKTMLQLGRYP